MICMMVLWLFGVLVFVLRPSLCEGRFASFAALPRAVHERPLRFAFPLLFRSFACRRVEMATFGVAPPPAPFQGRRAVLVFWFRLRRHLMRPGRSGLGARRNRPSPELGSLYMGLCSFPLHRLCLERSRTTPERGQMLRRTGVRPASFQYQSRHASPDRVLGRRPGAWGHPSEFAAFLRFALTGSSRAVASLL